MQTDSWYWQKTWSDFRRGTLPVTLAWDEGTAEITLYDQGAPATVRAFVERLPMELPVVHVAWSGDMVMGAHPIALGIREHENHTRLVRLGDLAFDPRFNEITLTYGTAEARLPSGPNTLAVFGSVTRGLEAFARWAHARRFEGLGVLRFTAAAQGNRT